MLTSALTIVTLGCCIVAVATLAIGTVEHVEPVSVTAASEGDVIVIDTAALIARETPSDQGKIEYWRAHLLAHGGMAARTPRGVVHHV